MIKENKQNNNKINQTMQYLFSQRLKYKKQKNPIQMVFKELMNSSYGKSYLKPIDSDSVYVPAKNFDEYMDRNFNYIKEGFKKGYKRKKFVSTNNNYKSLLGS